MTGGRFGHGEQGTNPMEDLRSADADDKFIQNLSLDGMDDLQHTGVFNCLAVDLDDLQPHLPFHFE